MAVGYRLKVSGTWSKPEDPFEPRSGPNLPDENTPEIETLFFDQAGNACGSARLQFLRSEEPIRSPYLVDRSNIDEVLRIIAGCALDLRP